jgi:ribosomal protein S3
MAQKINSSILRLGYKKNIWKSKYNEKTIEESSVNVFQDLEIKKYINRFFNLYGLIVHSCKINRFSNNLEVFISYFTTLQSVSLINSKNKLFLKTSYSTTIQKKNYSRKRSFSLLKHRDYLYKKKYKKKKSFNANNFIGKILISLNLFLKHKYNINIVLQNLNKSLSFRLKNYEALAFRKSIIKLRFYFKSFFFKEAINILILSIRKNLSAKILSNFIATQLSLLKRHNYFITFLKRALVIFIGTKYSLLNGVKLKIKGRFNGVPRAKTRILQIKNVPLQTFDSNIDYYQAVSYTTNGTFGVKIWISKK